MIELQTALMGLKKSLGTLKETKLSQNVYTKSRYDSRGVKTMKHLISQK